MRRFNRGLMIALIVAIFGVFGFAMPANASTQPITIGANVNLRSGPSTSNQVLGIMPAGSKPNYICYAKGQRVGGAGNQGTELWFKVTWSNITGYYTSFYDDVPLSKQNNIEGHYKIAKCGTGADINQTPSGNSTVNPAPTVYNRNAAASWAKEHAQDFQPVGWSGCTWFVSQAMWYGGMHQTAEWNGYTSRKGKVLTLPGTGAATSAPELVKYIEDHISYKSTDLDDKRFKQNAMPEAEIGDVIVYDWSRNGEEYNWSHFAIVVNIAPGNYPEVAERGTAGNNNISDYQKRGWTWSAKNSKWLQQDHPSMAARLYHFTAKNY